MSFYVKMFKLFYIEVMDLISHDQKEKFFSLATTATVHCPFFFIIAKGTILNKKFYNVGQFIRAAKKRL